MLHSARPRSEISRSFVCYRCVSTILPCFENEVPRTNSSHYWRLPPRRRNGSAIHLRPGRAFKTHSRQRPNNVTNLSPQPTKRQDLPLLDTRLIRVRILEKLRQWEAENAPPFVPPPIPIDESPVGEIRNSLMRKGSAEFAVDPNLDDTDEGLHTVVFGRDDLVDVGGNRVFLRPGDLVELLNLDGIDQELGIYIGDFETQSQFYTMSGRWMHRRSQHVRFYAPRFVEPHELDELRPYLPASDVPRDMQDKLHSITRLVPRSLGQSLIHKLLNFWAQSDAIYQAHSVALDNAHALVAYPTTFRYATLDEIASELLPEMARRADGNKLPYPALYAVHRSLLNSGVGFGPPKKRALRAYGSHFEIIPANHMANIKLVRNIVREHMESKFNATSRNIPSRPNRLERFVAKAQRFIDTSRKSRSYTHHGTVSPPSAAPSYVNNPGSGQLTGTFDGTDMQILQFIESWAGLRYFAIFSPLNGTGAAILRAVARYDQNAILAPSTAWVFLQEIGVMAPWQSRAAFDLRLEKTGLRQLAGPATRSTRGFVADKLHDIRKDWGDLPVYCIDNSDAHEIDDGISIEAADLPDQYWMHIHTADPGAHMNPESEASQYAAALVETIYMPECVFGMLPSPFVQAHLSLARNRPCLTYSAKMNSDGDILDYKVTAGRIRNVHHVTPRVVEEGVLKSYSKKHNSYTVGSELPVSKKRHLVESHELSDFDRENFRLIHAIGRAHSEKRAARGAVTVQHMEPEVLVSIKDKQKAKNVVPMFFDTDPSIKIVMTAVDDAVQLPSSEEHFNIVMAPMLIAGEVAARWCKDRGIPVINRITPRNEDKIDPAEYFVKHVLPTKNARGVFDQEKQKLYFGILGVVQPSVTPGPHISMGLEMFARCTSPLRRYPDLLLQWQVESALLEEARLGHSLIGNTNDSFLPFTKSQIESILPHIDARERLIAHGKRQGKKTWFFHLLLRAWKYQEAKIPSTFSFVVRQLDGENSVRGELEHFQTFAIWKRHDSTTFSELKVGDTLEVEIADINTYDLILMVTPIRYLNQSEKEVLDRENRLMMQSEEII